MKKMQALASLGHWRRVRSNQRSRGRLWSVSSSLAFLKSRPWTVWPNYGKSASPHASRMVRLAVVAAYDRALGAAAARIAQGQPLCTRGRLLSRRR